MNAFAKSAPIATSSKIKARAIPANRQSTLWPIMILLYALIVPPEFQLPFGSLVLYPNRIICLFAIPWLIHEIGQKGLKLEISDFLFIAFAAWMIVIGVLHEGLPGLQFGGGLAFDLIVPYFIARACIRMPEDFRRVLIYFLPGLAFAGAFMMIESVTHVGILRPVSQSIMGSFIQFDSLSSSVDVRWGLMRAQGPFAHPILAGLFVASLFPLYLMIGRHHVIGRVGGTLTSFFAFFSLSSVAFMLIGINSLLIAYDWLQKRLTMASWKGFVTGVVAVSIVLQLTTAGIARIIINYLTLNPATGWYRLLIWEYGSASVRAHPWFGIGSADYVRLFWMPATVDHNWLLVAIRFGLPGAFLYYLAIMLAIWKLTEATMRSRGITREIRIGLAFSLISLVFAGFTVAFFGSFSIYFPMLVAAAVSLSQPIKIAGEQRPSA